MKCFAVILIVSSWGRPSFKEKKAGMGKGRDGTVPRFFVPVPLVPRDNHAGQSRENLSRSRSSRRLLSRSRSHGTQKVSGQIGTRVPRDSPASPGRNPVKSRDNRPSLEKGEKRPRVDVWEPRRLYLWGNQWVKLRCN